VKGAKMKILKSNIIDVPISLFYYRYGINIDDALDLCHERGKILSPVIGKRATVSTGASGNLMLEEKMDSFYLLFLSDIMLKNDTIVSFKEEIVEVY